MKNYDLFLCDNDNCFNDYAYFIEFQKKKCYIIDYNVNIKMKSFTSEGLVKFEQLYLYHESNIIIFSYNRCKELSRMLIKDFGVKAEQIKDWYYYIFVSIRNVPMINLNLLSTIGEIFYYFEIRKVLDINFGFYRAGAKSREFLTMRELWLNFNNFVCIDGIEMEDKSEKFPNMSNLYNKLYESHDFYDVILLLDLFLFSSLDTVVEIIKKYLNKTRYLYISLPERNSLTFSEWNDYDFSVFGEIINVSREGNRAILIDSKKKERIDDVIEIYVVNHTKKAAQEDDIRKNIYVGNGIISTEQLSDAVKDNISNLNPVLNELTAIYWIWKNTTNDYVGIEHYRRKFVVNPYIYDDTKVLDRRMIKQYLEEYDFIVSKSGGDGILTVKECIQFNTNSKIFIEVFEEIKKIIKLKYPQYIKAFDSCFSGYTFYPCNLFITKRVMFDEYCTWLFDIILNFKEMDLLFKQEGENRRILGFIAERLLTVWLMNHDYKILELHYKLESE